MSEAKKLVFGWAEQANDDLDSMFGETLASPSIPEIQTPNPLFRRPDERDLWKTDGLRYVFIRSTCTSCGRVSVLPDGIFVHSTHARNHCEHLERVNAASDSSFAGLPRSVQYLDGLTSFCEGCLNV